MERDRERKTWITETLEQTGFDALVCTLAENVLLLTGYWPVVGTAIAVATAQGVCAVLAPDDEADLAAKGWADPVRTYAPGSLTSLTGPADAVREPLAKLLSDLGVVGGTIGSDDGAVYAETTYAAMFLYQAAVRQVLHDAAPGATLVTSLPALTPLRSRYTPPEVAKIRLACRVAATGFDAVPSQLRPGKRETEIAATLQSQLSVDGQAQDGVERAGAFAWCMSGANSAEAGGAYARSRNREFHDGDLILVHCNSYIDGYWTDITRTYCLGTPDDRIRAMYEAITEARQAALDTIRPGAAAADVDSAARDVLTKHGFGKYFTHGIGHNVGFSAISADFPPRLHPASPDRLEAGMTFNIEPSIYMEGFGGMRHCDVVAVHEDGPEVLTDFQVGMEELVV